jgi:hypothetical protein
MSNKLVAGSGCAEPCTGLGGVDDDGVPADSASAARSGERRKDGKV